VTGEWDISGKTVIITGGNSGVGREAAIALAQQGARVVITSRGAAKGDDALREIRRRGSESADVMRLDLASFDSIRSFAAEALERLDSIHVLINNAGGILSYRQETSEHFEMTFGVNHLGHFLLTNLLLDRIKESAPARIINVSSVAHRLAGGMTWSDLQRTTRGYNGGGVYNESKLANVLFTIELARRLDGTGVTVNCCHPGPVRTGFGSADDTSGMERFGMVLAQPFLIGARRGAAPLVHLAASPKVSGVTGKYFSRRPLAGLPGVRVSPHQVARAAREPGAPERLWEESEKLVASVS
jgi:NAD(P)-dependent dehydrogenase (short-subunit alcohol dehydrogenase family)